MKARNRRKTNEIYTCPVQTLVLDRVQNGEGMRESNTIDMTTIIQFRKGKYKIKMK